MIILKHRIEDGYLTRIIEVRKARGAPIHVAETFFSISENLGITVFSPPVLAELPIDGRKVEIVCKHLKEIIGHYHRGFIINIFYPPEPGAGLEALLGVLALTIVNNMKALVVSYTHPSIIIRENIKNRLVMSGLNSEKAEKVLEKHMVITALNPFAHSLTQLAARELAIIEQVKPDIVVFYGVHLARNHSGNLTVFLKELFNEAMYLKSKGIMVIRIGSCLVEYPCNAETLLADVTYKFEKVFREDGSIDTKVYVYRRFREPKVVVSNMVNECVKEWIEVIREYAEKL